MQCVVASCRINRLLFSTVFSRQPSAAHCTICVLSRHAVMALLLWWCCAHFVLAFGAASATVLLPACVKYCGDGDEVNSSTRCVSTVATGAYCTGGFTRLGVTNLCVNTVWCATSTYYQSAEVVGGQCYYGVTAAPVFDSNVNTTVCPDGYPYRHGDVCYSNSDPACPSPLSMYGSNLCSTPFPMGPCPTDYALEGGVCRRYYDALPIMNATVCTNATFAVGCHWCNSMSVCIPNTTTCPRSCHDATFDVCTVPPSACKWCDSVSVCQNKSGVCWNTCLDVSNDPQAVDMCTNSSRCSWCSGLGYCNNTNATCSSSCPSLRSSQTCGLGSVQATCRWCNATVGLEYCINRTEPAQLQCTRSCGSFYYRQDLCEGSSMCHWCGAHHGRCKPRSSSGYVGWRREVECDTGTETMSQSAEASHASVTTAVSRSCTPTATSSATFTTTSTFTASQSLGTDTALGTITLTDDHSSVTVQRSATSGLPSSLSDSPASVTDVESVSLWASKSATMTTLFTPTALSSLSPSLTRSLKTFHHTISTTEHVCSCSGDMISGESVVLAAPDVPQINSLLIRMNSSAAMMFLNPDASDVTKLTALPQTRRAMWTARALSLSLALQSHWSVDQFGRVNISGIETLCWRPSAALLRGERLDVAIARSQFTPHSDMVSLVVAELDHASGCSVMAAAICRALRRRYGPSSNNTFMHRWCPAGESHC